MIRTVTQMEYSRFSAPACLPSKKFKSLNTKPDDGPVCIISGWGRTETQRASQDLMYASVKVVSYIISLNFTFSESKCQLRFLKQNIARVM